MLTCVVVRIVVRLVIRLRVGWHECGCSGVVVLWSHIHVARVHLVHVVAIMVIGLAMLLSVLACKCRVEVVIGGDCHGDGRYLTRRSTLHVAVVLRGGWLVIRRRGLDVEIMISREAHLMIAIVWVHVGARMTGHVVIGTSATVVQVVIGGRLLALINTLRVPVHRRQQDTA